MFKVSKTDEPLFFKEYKEKKVKYKININDWKNYDYEIKRNLKKYMFEYEQPYFCPYCELPITLEESQIEHLKPKDIYPKLTSVYSNYITACKSSKTCGQSKGNSCSELFIDLTKENPQDYFTYDIKTGKIIPLADNGLAREKAEKTIEILNLNEPRLADERKNFIKTVLASNNSYYRDNLDYLETFPTLKDFLKNIIQK